ncbi:MAG: hypothetical protein DRG32_02775 [Deltaproteobacteria bacterium]|nr:MAG: hypothetical protein DRG32_02775 [Deltaproteobacteria bacterium]
MERVIENPDRVKSHRAKDPGSHLGPMFYQVIGTVFQLAIDFEFIKYYLIAKWNQTPKRDDLPSIAQYLAEEQTP